MFLKRKKKCISTMSVDLTHIDNEVPSIILSLLCSKILIIMEDKIYLKIKILH